MLFPVDFLRNREWTCYDPSLKDTNLSAPNRRYIDALSVNARTVRNLFLGLGRGHPGATQSGLAPTRSMPGILWM